MAKTESNITRPVSEEATVAQFNKPVIATVSIENSTTTRYTASTNQTSSIAQDLLSLAKFERPASVVANLSTENAPTPVPSVENLAALSKTNSTAHASVSLAKIFVQNVPSASFTSSYNQSHAISSNQTSSLILDKNDFEKLERPVSVFTSNSIRKEQSPAPSFVSSKTDTRSIAQELVNLAKMEKENTIVKPALNYDTSQPSVKVNTIAQDLVTLVKHQKPSDKVLARLVKSESFTAPIINTYIEPIFVTRESPSSTRSRRSSGQKKIANDFLEQIKNENKNMAVTSLTITTISDSDDSDSSDSSAAESSFVPQYIEYEERILTEDNIEKPKRFYQPIIQTRHISKEKQGKGNYFDNGDVEYDNRNPETYSIKSGRNLTPSTYINPVDLKDNVESRSRTGKLIYIGPKDSNYNVESSRNAQASSYIGPRDSNYAIKPLGKSNLSSYLDSKDSTYDIDSGSHNTFTKFMGPKDTSYSVEPPNYESSPSVYIGPNDRLSPVNTTPSRTYIGLKDSLAPKVTTYSPKTPVKNSLARDLLEMLNKENPDVFSFVTKRVANQEPTVDYKPKENDTITNNNYTSEKNHSRKKYTSVGNRHSFSGDVPRGAIKLDNGDSYDGEIRDSKFNGKGTYVSGPIFITEYLQLGLFCFLFYIVLQQWRQICRRLC